MLDPQRRGIVVNTSPTLALLAATGSLMYLRRLYDRIILPREVVAELMQGDSSERGIEILLQEAGIVIWERDAASSSLLSNTLGIGEAAVIQLAMTESIPLVAIDEKTGRRVARLCGLGVTGSLGILLKARQLGLVPSLRECLVNMAAGGIWLSPEIKSETLRLAGED